MPVDVVIRQSNYAIVYGSQLNPLSAHSQYRLGRNVIDKDEESHYTSDNLKNAAQQQYSGVP
jgi:hypothetical protein